MSRFEVITQGDLMNDSNEKQFNILNPRDYQRSLEELSKNENLFDLIRKGFQLTYDITRGLQLNELQELIQSEHGEDAQFMLKEVKKLSEGQSTWLAATSANAIKRESILIFGKFIDGKYDLLNVRATQIKTFDEQRLIACGIGAVCTGVMFGLIATPLAAVVAGGSILAASGAKAALDYRKPLPDLIYGYIFKELINKNVIHVENGHYKI